MPLPKGTKIVVTDNKCLDDVIGVGSIGTITSHLPNFNDGFFDTYNVEFNVIENGITSDLMLMQVISEKHFNTLIDHDSLFELPLRNSRTSIYDDKEII